MPPIPAAANSEAINTLLTKPRLLGGAQGCGPFLSWRSLFRHHLTLISLWSAWLVVPWPGQAELPWLPDLKEGEVAPMDVIAPDTLVVFNPERTTHRAEMEMRRVPLIFRHCTDADLEAEAELRLEVARQRRQFKTALASAYKKEALSAGELSKPKFQRLLATHRRKNPGFPLSEEMAHAWATDQTDEPALQPWVAQLGEWMKGWIRADSLPEGISWTGQQVRLVPLARHAATPSLTEAAGMGRMVNRTNLVTLTRLRRDMRAVMEGEDKVLARFLVRFLRENCILEEALSQQARVEKGRSIWVVDRYPLGSVMLRRGQVVDVDLARALREVREGRLAQVTEAMTRRQLQREAEARAEARVQALQPAPTSESAWVRLAPWILGSLMMGGFAVLGGGWWWRRRRAQQSLALLRSNQDTINVMTCPSCSNMVRVPDEIMHWRNQAEAAERRAEDAMGLLRGGLLPALAQWVKSRAVRALVGQRNQLRREQAEAEAEIQRLTRRLELMHAPIADRIKAYETRIAELEAELAAKGEENRALLQAQVEALREQLLKEQRKSSLKWN